ncbi:MAG: CBS domain-containing protein [Nitrosopumilaceae archaeon]|jgi:signal-transduction protein with cAMP-binding, CBS, and nucleotidyltransferase domain
MTDSNSSPPVSKIMNKALIFVNPETTSYQVAKMMKEGGISAIFIKEKEEFIGIVTDRDFATKIAVNKLSFETPIKNIMSSPIITIDHQELIASAAKLMGKNKIRKLAVTENGKVVGILRAIDFVKYHES